MTSKAAARKFLPPVHRHQQPFCLRAYPRIGRAEPARTGLRAPEQSAGRPPRTASAAVSSTVHSPLPPSSRFPPAWFHHGPPVVRNRTASPNCVAHRRFSPRQAGRGRLRCASTPRCAAGGCGGGEPRKPAAMPRYYFVLSNRDGLIDDVEGTELPDLAAARREAEHDVEHLRQHRVGGRRCWAGWAMQVHDDSGAVLLVVPFSRSARARRRAQRT